MLLNAAKVQTKPGRLATLKNYSRNMSSNAQKDGINLGDTRGGSETTLRTSNPEEKTPPIILTPPPILIKTNKPPSKISRKLARQNQQNDAKSKISKNKSAKQNANTAKHTKQAKHTINHHAAPHNPHLADELGIYNTADIILPDGSKLGKGKNPPPNDEDFTSALAAMGCNETQIEDGLNIVHGGIDHSDYVKPIINDYHKKLLHQMENKEEVTQYQNVHYMKYYLPPHKVKVFENTFPHLQIRATKPQRYHETPLTADEFERLNDEITIISKQLFGKMQMVDICGDPNYHGENVWTCTPVKLAQDACNNYTYRNNDNWCDHEAISCHCVQPDAYISIDSLYYFSPHDIAMLVIKSKNKLLLAAHYFFDDAFGSFSGGEVTYMIEDQNVRITSKPSLFSRLHNNLSWMRLGGYHFVIGSKQYTLAWKVLQQYSSKRITMFTIHPGHLPLNDQSSQLFTTTLQTTDYYGNVTLNSALGTQSTMPVPGQSISCDKLDLYSWGPFVIMFNTSTQVRYYAPKGLTNEIALYISGRKRTPESFANAHAHCRLLSKKYNLPLQLLSNTIFAATCLGFISNVVTEIELMHSIVKPVESLFSVHTDSLNHKYKYVLTWKKIAAMAISAAVVSKTLGVAVACVPGVGPAIASYLAVGTSLSLATSLACAYSYNNSKNNITTFDSYIKNRSSLPFDQRTYPINFTKLPSTDPIYTEQELIDLPIDITASLNIVDLESRRPEHYPLEVAGIVTTHSIGIVPSSSALSSVAALKTRQLKPQPVHSIEFDPEYFGNFYKYSIKYFDHFIKQRQTFSQKLYSTWNLNFPKHQRLIHNKAVMNFIAGPYQSCNKRGLFPKIEANIKSDTLGVEKIDPRAIQSNDPIHNVHVAPSIHTVSDILSSDWSIKEKRGIVYTSKVSAQCLGTYFDRAIKEPSKIVIEGDYSRFDSSVHAGLLRLENQYYSMMGVPQTVLDSLENSITTEGYDKYSNAYKVLGTRHSGDPNTSCGNTLLQGLMSTYAFATTVNKENPPSPQDTWDKLEINGMLLGDDSLFIVADTTNVKQYVLNLRKLGVDLEPIVHRDLDAIYKPTFCSSRFYPVQNRDTGEITTVLAPPIGRVLTKAGYYVNIPKTMKPLEILRGDALSRYQNIHCIPFLKEYWETIIKLTENEKAKVTNKMINENRHKNNLTDRFGPCAETWEMLFYVYGLTRDNLVEYTRCLERVKSLPYVMDLNMFHRAMAVDGMAPDREQTGVILDPIEEIVPPINKSPSDSSEFMRGCVKHCVEVIKNPVQTVTVDLEITPSNTTPQ